MALDHDAISAILRSGQDTTKLVQVARVTLQDLVRIEVKSTLMATDGLGTTCRETVTVPVSLLVRSSCACIGPGSGNNALPSSSSVSAAAKIRKWPPSWAGRLPGTTAPSSEPRMIKQGLCEVACFSSYPRHRGISVQSSLSYQYPLS
jgi:hypothetical protein